MQPVLFVITMENKTKIAAMESSDHSVPWIAYDAGKANTDCKIEFNPMK